MNSVLQPDIDSSWVNVLRVRFEAANICLYFLLSYLKAVSEFDLNG